MLFRFSYSVVLAALLVANQGELMAADRSAEAGKTRTPQTDTSSSMRFAYEKTVGSDGKIYWLVNFSKSKYRISDDYVRNVGRETVSLEMHWPSTKAWRVAVASGTKVEAKDFIEIMLSPPRLPPTPDYYVSITKTSRDYKKRPSDRYPGLLEYVMLNPATGHLAPGGEYVSTDGMPRTPSGNPYAISAQVTVEDPNSACDTTIALPDSSSVRVRFRKKHLSDWHRIYPEVLRLIESFRKG